MAVSFREWRGHWHFSNCDGGRGILLDLWFIREVGLVITLDIGRSFGLVNMRHNKLRRLALPANIPEDEEGATEGSDEDNRNGNPGNSSCTNTVRAIVGAYDNGSAARSWVGDCGTGCVGMRYGYDVTGHRRVESCL